MTSRALFLVPLVLVVACSSKQDLPPPVGDDFDSGGGDVALGDQGTPDSSHDTAAADGFDAPTESGGDSSVGDTGPFMLPDGAMALDGATTVDEVPPGTICDVTLGPVGSGTVSTIESTTDDDLLASVTPDGLTIAWFGVAASGDATLYVADRASTGSAFGAKITQTPPTEGFSPKRVALSADGLRLVFVAKNGRSMRQLTRASRSGAFDTTSDAAPFADVNALVGEGTATLGFPVLASDDLTLYFSTQDTGADPILRRSTRSGTTGTWPAGAVMSEPDLSGTGAKSVVATGLSSDGLTLFVWNDPKSRSIAAYRTSPTGPFTSFVPIGPRKYVSPSSDCKTLYYSAAGTAGVDVVTER